MPSLASNLPKWVRYRAAGYLRGKGISFGIPSLIDGPLFPILAHEGTAFELSVSPIPHSHAVTDDLSIFSNESFDHVVVGGGNPQLNELVTKLKVGGHLVIIGQGEPAGSWQLKEDYTQDRLRVAVYKKIPGKSNVIKPIRAITTKRACIVRYGAIGDALQLTPVIHQLADEGYEVTLNISPYTAEVYKYNPHVKNIIYQERSVIPNIDLGEYWRYWQDTYDLYINFSESIEGKLLKVEGRGDFYTPQAWRRATCDINYHDQHNILAKLDHSKYTLPELYFSKAEQKDALNEMRPLANHFVIAWSLKGSSHHKSWPYYKVIAKEWLDNHPDSMILQLGGQESIPLQVEHAGAIPLAGSWDLRKVFSVLPLCQVVIGPESAIVNAASCFDVPKICMLSHSTKNNLTKYWSNNYSIMPNTDIAPCYPCHQLHYNKESCPTVDMEFQGKTFEQLAVCTTAIAPEVVYDQLEVLYNQWLSGRRAPAN